MLKGDALAGVSRRVKPLCNLLITAIRLGLFFGIWIV